MHILRKIEDTLGFRLSQGVGGAVELAPGYLKLVYDIVRNAGGVCIADEVQTGFGRTGSHYWGFETQGVIPDIVTMAKVLFLSEFLDLQKNVFTPRVYLCWKTTAARCPCCSYLKTYS